jgi:acylphosphatase
VDAGSSVRQRREIYFSGHVQGVGFRYVTHRVARQYDVTGFVRNLRDSRVHLVVEGEAGEIDRFVDEVSSRMGSYIRSKHQVSQAYSGEFGGFSIRFEGE